MTPGGRGNKGGVPTSRDTIYALASGAGRAGVAVIRISGPEAGPCVERLTGRPPPGARTAALRTLQDPVTGEAVDRGLVLWFPAPHSFTGEDVAELQGHGGRAVVTALLDLLGRQPGLRLAEPGEFTRRAFEAGRLDLTAAEGLADLVDAETEAQRRQAQRQLGGAVARVVEDWRERLIRAGAWLEAEIDFSDQDLPGTPAATVAPALAGLLAEMRAHLAASRQGEQVREGVSVAILGAPNVGKSSLLNRIARRDAAIVSAVAGTTRDVLEVRLDLDGYPVILADTAGLREAADEVEAEGVRRALARAAEADVKLVVFDAGRWPALEAESVALVDETALPVLNKADTGAGAGTLAAEPSVAGVAAVRCSARTGHGLPDLLGRLGAAVRQRFHGMPAGVLTRARHREALGEACRHLERALAADALELIAEDLRLATRALGRITGRVDVEDLLDVVFRDFCIGK